MLHCIRDGFLGHDPTRIIRIACRHLSTLLPAWDPSVSRRVFLYDAYTPLSTLVIIAFNRPEVDETLFKHYFTRAYKRNAIAKHFAICVVGCFGLYWLSRAKESYGKYA